MDTPIAFKGFGGKTPTLKLFQAKDDSRPSSSRTVTLGSYSDEFGHLSSKTTRQLMMPTQSFSAREPIQSIPLLAEKSLGQMGFNSEEFKNWEQIVEPPNANLLQTLRHMVMNQIKPNVQIGIGSVTFQCHMMVLQCYSDFFLDFSNEVFIQLPEEKVTAGAFMMIYGWMLDEQPRVEREGILDLYNAASFLRINSIINQFWVCLDSDALFREDTAFMLYKEARSLKMEDIMQLMLTRICKFFFTIVASQDFVDLNVDEVYSLLSSNTVGVNSETEIFFSMVRWLNHNWEVREQHLPRLIKCVRFTLMPPWFLITLNKPTKTMEIDRITEEKTVSKIINDAMCYVTTHAIYGHLREELVAFLERYNLQVPIQRQWIYDKEYCNHHRVDCGKTQHVTYNSFLQYLDMVQSKGKQYWHTLSHMRADEPCSGCLCMAKSVSAVAISTDEKPLKNMI